MDICNQACDNHAANNELCAKNIKVDQVSVEMMSRVMLRWTKILKKGQKKGSKKENCSKKD